VNPRTAHTVENDTVDHRFTVTVDGATGELRYDERDGRLYLIHTEVPESLAGQGLASQLVIAALDYAQREDLVVVPWCPFARRWLRNHPDAVGGVTVDWRTLPPTAPEAPRPGANALELDGSESR